MEYNKEMLLKDFSGYEIVYKKQNKYLYIGLFSAVLLVILRILTIAQSRGEIVGPNMHFSGMWYGILFGGMLVTIAYFTHPLKYLKISGQSNYIEFSINNLIKNNLADFLESLTNEARKCKIGN